MTRSELIECSQDRLHGRSGREEIAEQHLDACLNKTNQHRWSHEKKRDKKNQHGLG